jgi:undecaprenyl-diphosphatase
MPVLFKILILAIVQGLTEFLPVSSSGHLVLMNRWLGIQTPGLMLVVGLHIGTLMSVVVYYRKRLLSLVLQLFSRKSEGWRYVLALILGSIPVVLLGLSCGHYIENLATNPRIVAGLLVINGVVLLTLLVPHPAGKAVNPVRALVIGAAQALAAMPGISRAGSTIVAASHLGIPAKEAAEFSLLLSIPAIVGSAGYEWIRHRAESSGDVSMPIMMAGITISAVVGYLAISLLVKALSSGKFWIFGIYCVIIGIAGLIMRG